LLLLGKLNILKTKSFCMDEMEC